MKRNQAAFFMALAILPISLLSCNKDVMTDNEKAKADFLENVKRIEEAVQEVDPDMKALGYTEVTQISYVYKDESDIQYYYCKTTYFDEIPEITGVHLDAIKGVVDPNMAESSRDAKVLNYDAIIYTLNGREYLCWSLSPEDSCVMEYTPGTVPEEDIWMMAESVQ